MAGIGTQQALLADRALFSGPVEAFEDATQELRACYHLEGIVGRSSALATALGQAMLAAPLDVNVLLTGESGTGKSQLARLIHSNGPRTHGPFVDINCAAIPSTLLESELFGARAGSHSEAHGNREGRIAAAEGGTLFLDEVSELPYEAQAKLLQLLQSRTYYPLGESSPVEADVRVIAATNCDLEDAVREKHFRGDLFFRLQVLPVRLPSLRERGEDLLLLAAELCAAAQQRQRIPRLPLSPRALLAIQEASWPGNVRQLENAVEAAAIRAAGEAADAIEEHHVFPATAAGPGNRERARSFREATRCFQRMLLERSLKETGWNVAESARRLELTRSHVYNLISAFELCRNRPR